MSARILFLFLAVAGLAVLVALMARGWDAQRAAESGPRWRRHLVCAALFLLACLGCSSGGKLTPPPEAAAPVVAGQPLEETAQWQFVTATWREAEEVASGKRGDHPFDRKGKEALLKAIQEATAIINKLATAGTLSEPEAGLLTSGFALLSEGVSSKRPTEMIRVTCYDSVAVAPAEGSLNRLRARLPLLKKLAAKGTVHRAVLEKVLPSIEADLKILKSPDEAKRLDPKVQAEAEGVWEESEAALSEIKRLLQGIPRPTQPPADLQAKAMPPLKAGQLLEETPQWKLVSAVWREADETAAFKHGDHPFDAQGKKVLIASVQEAMTIVGQLVKAGMLSEPEAELLTVGFRRNLDNIQLMRTTELRNATCYECWPFESSDAQSLKRLQHRIPLLQRLARDNAIRRSVLEALRPSLEADLKTFATATGADVLKLRQDGQAVLAELERLLEARK